MFKTLRTKVSNFIKRNIIADDPNPQYSRLDRMDGLGIVLPSSQTQSKVFSANRSGEQEVTQVA